MKMVTYKERIRAGGSGDAAVPKPAVSPAAGSSAFRDQRF